VWIIAISLYLYIDLSSFAIASHDIPLGGRYVRDYSEAARSNFI